MLIPESEITQVTLLACAWHCAKSVLPNDFINGGGGGEMGSAYKTRAVRAAELENYPQGTFVEIEDLTRELV